jgi:hypothetical protein
MSMFLILSHPLRVSVHLRQADDNAAAQAVAAESTLRAVPDLPAAAPLRRFRRLRRPSKSTETLSKDAPELSPTAIISLKDGWLDEYEAWQKRDLEAGQKSWWHLDGNNQLPKTDSV